MTLRQFFDSFGILTHGGPRKCQKNGKKLAKKWPKMAKNGQKWPKTGEIVTKRPITRPIECMAPSLLQFWNPHTWGAQEMPKTAKNCQKNWPKFAKNCQKWPKTAKIVTKRPITRPIECMAPSLLQFWNPHTWGAQEMPKTAKNCQKNWPKFAKNCQKWPKTAKIVTKRPITRPIECMAPSLLQFWNPHT